MLLNRSLFIGGLLSLFSWSLPAQVAKVPSEPVQQPQNVVLKSIFSQKADTTLLADNVKLKDKKRADELNKEIARSISEELSKEELMYPAIEVYGRDSWHTSSVNPFVGGSSVAVPDTFHIDCTQFSYPLGDIRRVNSHYGYRRRFGRMHYGVDLKLAIGDTVRAAFDGRIRMVAFERRGYGHYVVMRHPNGLETIYGHLSRSLVKPDQIVKAGDPIALGGNTGRSTGPHLHFETRFLGIAINPETIIDFNKGIPLSDQYVFLRHKMGVKATTATTGNHGGRVVAKGQAGSALKTHKIRKGESLSTIASKYGVSVATICKLNGISTRTTLRVGRTLRIS